MPRNTLIPDIRCVNERLYFGEKAIDTVVSITDPPIRLDIKFSGSMSHSLARETDGVCQR